MKKFKSHFRFSKQERSGIFYLLLVIAFLQLSYVALDYLPLGEKEPSFIQNKEWQSQIDSLQNLDSEEESEIYPFNPNYITDYKGYTLGMSNAEIDRLHEFRSKGKFVNSALEFKKVTQISDSLLSVISPYFKFPDWVNTKNNSTPQKVRVSKEKNQGASNELKDLNKATAQDLRVVNGIGEKLSARIVKFRDRLGGFLVDEQLYDVYHLEPEVVERVLERFKVMEKPVVNKININASTAEEISKLVYIRYSVAEAIVRQRMENGSILSFDELKHIDGFPSDKIDRIALYLSL
ncbi:helix-hairpin-helix domain-containing protein [Cytophaga sp. FL35]|uniref:ComEA family DNA-binding protein n=1 Tax=Cytophaga sp. FL35 TaxID=1904456 RepID=UPI001653EB6A|nr:helix-hairpin-helix domain-containing protein [Cytophaga sp. FL35]MBC6999574.1 helix-hairpin-helix domain-containing protein [Cytophaga sp. FL35]